MGQLYVTVSLNNFNSEKTWAIIFLLQLDLIDISETSYFSEILLKINNHFAVILHS